MCFRGDDSSAEDERVSGVSSADPMPAAGSEAPAMLRLYLAHERGILGALMVMLSLIAWEGLERGWWAQALRPLIGPAAERWQLKPIFISSPTLIAASAFRMYFVNGEIWRDL